MIGSDSIDHLAVHTEYFGFTRIPGATYDVLDRNTSGILSLTLKSSWILWWEKDTPCAGDPIG